MRRGVLGWSALVACVAAVAVAAFGSSATDAAGVRTCRAAEKAKHVKALAAFTREQAAKRRAFFRSHADPAARRTFVARQQARLVALRRAASCRVVPENADLAVSMSASGAAELVFTIVVANHGPGPAVGASVTDSLPRGVELVSATSTGGRCARGPSVTCSLGALAPGTKVTVTIATRRYLAGVIENTASVGATTRDPSAANNSTTARSTDLPLATASSGPPCAPELTFPGPRAYFHLGPTNYTLYQQATGRLGAVLLFVDFPDAPSSAPTGPIFSAAVPALTQWYAEASYGRLTLAVDQVPNWLRLPKSALAYDLHYRGDYPGIVARHRAFLADAVAAADPLVDFGRYSTVLIVAAPHPGTSARMGVPFAVGSGVVADGNELRGLVVAALPLANPPDLVHETGHLFGLPDIYDFSVPFAEGTRYLGRWEPMSNTGSLAHFLGWVKWKLGWLDPSQLRCLSAAGTLDETLSPIETPGGVKLVVLPTGATTATVVEVHTLRSSRNQVCDSGVIVYSVDVQAPSGTASARIRPGRDDPTSPECGAIPRAALDVGPGEVASYEDGQLRVDVLGSDGSSYRVRVTRK